MTKAADIIAALLAGKPAPVIERHTGMPYGWGLWLRALKDRLGHIGRDTAEGMVTALAQRPVPPPAPRLPALGRWQAFRAVFYPDWGPPLREERGLRWFAATISVLMHLMFVLLLVLFALVNLPPPEPAADSGRVQVEFIGAGTPEEQGGGPPVAGAEASAQAATTTAPPAAAAAQAEATAVAAEAAATPPRETEVAEVSPPEAQQNVQVTEVPVATTEFVLPPATQRPTEFAPPQIRPRELSMPVREVAVTIAPPIQRPLPQREVAVPPRPNIVPEVRQREIAAPLSPIRNAQLPDRAMPVPQVQAATPGVRQAEIAMPDRGSASAGRNASASNAAMPGNAGPAAAVSSGTQPGTSASGSASGPRPGAAPTPRRGDDWGASTRNVPGQSGGSTVGEGPGLFNADGSARVPDAATGNAAGNASRPGAPGSKQQQRADADRASKWLERPEYPYEPTMFDKYWVPNESVLAEWVRRAIREVEVPIPGSSKRVKCVVSVLQAGGACGLFDPNLNEQPAGARPPPDIPVKRNPIPVDS